MTMKFDEAQVQRTMSGIVRAEISSIELWLNRGARLSDIYQQFGSQGMVGSFDGFKKAVQRARTSVGVQVGSSNSEPTSLEITTASAPSSVLVLTKETGSPQPRAAVPVTSPMAQPKTEEKIDVDQFFKRKSIFDR